MANLFSGGTNLALGHQPEQLKGIYNPSAKNQLA